MKLIGIILISLVFTMNARANDEKETKEASNTEVICSNKVEKRKLVLVKEESGCRVDYTKGEETKSIGNQKTGTDFCEKLIDRVKEKLGKDFECK